MGPSSYVQAVGSLRTCCLLRLSAPARGRLATAAASFGAKSALFRNLAPLLRVVGRRHRIIAREVPLGAIFIGRHVMIGRSEEHTSELQSLMRISYAVFCLKKK